MGVVVLGVSVVDCSLVWEIEGKDLRTLVGLFSSRSCVETPFSKSITVLISFLWPVRLMTID